MNESKACKLCPIGWFQDSNDMMNTDCKRCGEQTLYTNEEGQATCKTCGVGSYTTDIGTSDGNKDNGDTQTTCTICSPGEYCEGDGKVRDCPPGFVTSSSEMKKCAKCLFGKYRDQPKGSTCSVWRNCPSSQGRIESRVDYIYDINCTVCDSNHSDGDDSLSYNGANDTSITTK